MSLRHVPDGVVLTITDTGIGLRPARTNASSSHSDVPSTPDIWGCQAWGWAAHLRQIAEAHGGRMWAESDGEGQGITVGMWLPPA
jgi:light-regulated signal transduction histidine kinase (bacteriophytochrome)